MIRHQLNLFDVITSIKLRKMVVFPNLIQMVKNIDSWVWKSGYVWGRC